MLMSLRFAALLAAGYSYGQATTIEIMKLKSIIGSILTLGLLAGGLTACVTEKEEDKEGQEANAAKLEAQAEITKAEAEKIALDKVPGGTIKEGGIEKEKGKVIWSFDIATPGTKDITEVLSDGGIEYKYYAKDVGCVMELPESGDVALKSHATK
jgi:uncharacterized membrane protein YkoI